MRAALVGDEGAGAGGSARVREQLERAGVTVRPVPLASVRALSGAPLPIAPGEVERVVVAGGDGHDRGRSVRLALEPSAVSVDGEAVRPAPAEFGVAGAFAVVVAA